MDIIFPLYALENFVSWDPEVLDQSYPQNYRRVLDEAVISFSSSERLSDISSVWVSICPFKPNTQEVAFLLMMSSKICFYEVNVG